MTRFKQDPIVRYNERKKYYAKHRLNTINSYRRWCKTDEELVLKHEEYDVVLKKFLGRSVEAIQLKRYKLKKLIEEGS